MKTLYYNCKIIAKGKITKGALLVNNGVISGVIAAETLQPRADKKVNLKGQYLTAGFIDTHIHGAGRYGTDVYKAGELLEMSTSLKKQGVAGFSPTLYPTNILNALNVFAAEIGKEAGAKIIGFHLEGPFLSPKKLGAMHTNDIKPVDLNLMKRLYVSSGGNIRAVTVAPELAGICGLAKFCAKRKIILQAGHTDATYGEMLKAEKCGITHATHLFNAMRAVDRRDPGAAGAVLTERNFTCEIIADGVHVHPSLVMAACKLKGAGKIILITDSLNPTGFKKGTANGDKVVLSGGVYRKESDGTIAGSALTMLQGVKNLIKWGVPIAKAFMTASENPAKLYKLNFGTIERGKEAKLIVLDKNFNLTKVLF
jgi:N-acetylglucosamine-6-phosphate deacetylase